MFWSPSSLSPNVKVGFSTWKTGNFGISRKFFNTCVMFANSWNIDTRSLWKSLLYYCSNCKKLLVWQFLQAVVFFRVFKQYISFLYHWIGVWTIFPLLFYAIYQIQQLPTRRNQLILDYCATKIFSCVVLKCLGLNFLWKNFVSENESSDWNFRSTNSSPYPSYFFLHFALWVFLLEIDFYHEIACTSAMPYERIKIYKNLLWSLSPDKKLLD